MTSQLPFPDAVRLLRRRAALVEDLSDQSLSCSLQAFLAWRAFMIVGRGHSPPDWSEREKCRSLFGKVLPAYDLTDEARQFVRGLSALNRQSPATLVEWFADPEDPLEVRDHKIRSAKGRVTKLERSTLKDAAAGSLIGDAAYDVRNAALAHASVHTTGNVFEHVITPFGALLEIATCAGIALLANVPLDAVIDEVDSDA